MKNSKKKGFTLIELIAVIAILAILGAVLVPRIGGYQAKARRSNAQTTAKTIVHAIQAYNADKDSSHKIGNGVQVSTAVTTINTELGGGTNIVIPTSGDAYASVSGLSVGQLVTVSNGGTFTMTGNTVNASSVTSGDIDN
jgi:prepilin-type N-terminal cleavage/methylation domain-containing protein